MSKKRNINDQIVEILKPREIQDPEEADVDDLTSAKLSVFDEQCDEQEEGRKRLSDIRKRQVTDVTKTHRKYKGQVVSRAELEKDFEASSSDEEVDEDGEKYATDTDDDDDALEASSVDGEEESDEEQESEGHEEQNEEDSDASSDMQPNQILRPEALSEKVRQGKAVKVQLQLWEKLLEMRIKSQKLLTLANSLPFGEAFNGLNSNSEFSNAVSSTTDTLLDLLGKNRDLQKTLVEQFPESKEIPSRATRKRKLPSSETLDAKRAHIDHLWDDLDSFTTNYKSYRNSVIQKWHDRTKIATNVKSLKTMESQSVIQKIDHILLNRNDLRRKTQIYRGGYEIIGHRSVETSPRSTETCEDTQDDVISEIPMKKDPNVYVPEIYDDSDFYHQLLRELIEFKTSTSSNPQELEQKYQELHQLRNKMKKSVDTRASKGRKIRYVVHNKLVNFMAPVPDDSSWSEEAKTELYNSLFDKLLTTSES